MSGAWVQTKTAQAGSATSVGVTLSSNPTAGNHLVAATFAWQSSAPTINAVTGGGTWAGTPALAEFSDTSSDSLRVDYCESATGGATTVTAHTAAAAFINCQVSESSGVASSASLGAVNHTSGSGSVASVVSGSITPVAGSVVYTFVMSSSANTAAMTAPTNYTVSSDSPGWNGGSTVRAGTAYRNNVPASATNPSWAETSGNATMSAAIVEFLASAGGGAINGTAAPIFGPWTVAAAGAETFTGTAAPLFGPWTVAASGNATSPSINGTAAVTFGPWTVAAAGAETISGSAAPIFGPWTVAASGAEIFSGAAALTLPKWVVAASGTFSPPGTVVGQAALVLPRWLVAITGDVTNPEIPLEPLLITYNPAADVGVAYAVTEVIPAYFGVAVFGLSAFAQDIDPPNPVITAEPARVGTARPT